MNRMVKYVVLVGLMTFLVVAGFGAGFVVSRAGSQGVTIGHPDTSAPAGVDQNFRVFWEAWRLAERDFVDRNALDPDKMTQGAIKGLMESLGDKYTTYIDSSHYKLEKSGLQGVYGGIGAEVAMQDDRVTIVAAMAESPAAKAGVRSGDKILKVNGEDTQGWTVQDVVSRIRGTKGTSVHLTLQRQGQSDPYEVDIVRDEIKTSSVLSKVLPSDNFGYVRITQFTERTNDELVPQLKELKSQGIKGLVLDLRSNPGGRLDTTVDVASQFLNGGVVLYQVDGKGERKTYNVRDGGVAKDLPIVVLVDKGSASGSEVLSGALQDRKRAVLIGEGTYGKGSVTHVFELSDGSAINVTFARWLTPNGTQIEGKGLTPDIELKLTDEDIKNRDDRQLQRGIDYLKNGS